jgi:N-carbamoyl-L-amino-acid hydrolase
VTVWLDARAETEQQTRAVVADIQARVAGILGEGDHIKSTLTEESWAGSVAFDSALSAKVSAALGGLPALPSGAGHDAGALSPHAPSAMLFVRNPTGISHSPEEFADADDCVDGVLALEKLLRSVL